MLEWMIDSVSVEPFVIVEGVCLAVLNTFSQRKCCLDQSRQEKMYTK